MNLVRQRQRFFIAMSVTVACAIIALVAIIGAFGLHLGRAMWVFGAAILAGFGAHGWLMLGVLRDRSGS